MKLPHNISVIRSTSASRVSFGLIAVGIVTAIFCSLALLNETSSTGGEGRRSQLVEAYAISHLNEIFTSKLEVSRTHNKIKMLLNSLSTIK